MSEENYDDDVSEEKKDTLENYDTEIQVEALYDPSIHLYDSDSNQHMERLKNPFSDYPYTPDEKAALKLWFNSSNEAIYMTLSPLYYAYIDVSDVKKLKSAEEFIEKLKKLNPTEYQRLVNQANDWIKQQEEQVVNHLIYKAQNNSVDYSEGYTTYYSLYSYYFTLKMSEIYNDCFTEHEDKKLDSSFFEPEIKTRCLAFLKKTKEENPKLYQDCMRQERDWALAIEFKTFMDKFVNPEVTKGSTQAEEDEENFDENIVNHLSKVLYERAREMKFTYNFSDEEKLSAEKKLMAMSDREIVDWVKIGHEIVAKKIKEIATENKQQAAKFMSKTDYYKTNQSENDKLQEAKNEIAKYEKEDLEKYRELMKKARHWSTTQTIALYTDLYIANYIKKLQAKDEKAKNITKNLKAWVTKYVKVDFEQVKKKQKTLLEAINDAFAHALDHEGKLATFMLQRSTAGNPGQLIGGNAIHAYNHEKAKEIIENYKLNKPDVYDDLVKRAGWHADYERQIYNLDYVRDCNTPFQPGSGSLRKEEKFAAWTMAMCRGPLGLYMESAFNGNNVYGELTAAREKLVWSYGIRCVGYKADSINMVQFLDQVKACFEAKTNDEKRIKRLVNGRGQKRSGRALGDPWKVGTCEITAVFIKEDTYLKESDSIQYDSGKEMVPVHYKKGA